MGLKQSKYSILKSRQESVEVRTVQLLDLLRFDGGDVLARIVKSLFRLVGLDERDSDFAGGLYLYNDYGGRRWRGVVCLAATCRPLFDLVYGSRRCSCVWRSIIFAMEDEKCSTLTKFDSFVRFLARIAPTEIRIQLCPDVFYSAIRRNRFARRFKEISFCEASIHDVKYAPIRDTLSFLSDLPSLQSLLVSIRHCADENSIIQRAGTDNSLLNRAREEIYLDEGIRTLMLMFASSCPNVKNLCYLTRSCSVPRVSNAAARALPLNELYKGEWANLEYIYWDSDVHVMHLPMMQNLKGFSMHHWPHEPEDLSRMEDNWRNYVQSFIRFFDIPDFMKSKLTMVLGPLVLTLDPETKLASLPAYGHLQVLYLMDFDFESGAELRHVGRLRHLKHLSFHTRGQVDEAAFDDFLLNADFTLSVFTIINIRLPTSVVDILRPIAVCCSSLWKIELIWCELMDEVTCLAHCISIMPCLRELVLHNCYPGGSSTDAEEIISFHRRLLDNLDSSRLAQLTKVQVVLRPPASFSDANFANAGAYRQHIMNNFTTRFPRCRISLIEGT